MLPTSSRMAPADSFATPPPPVSDPDSRAHVVQFYEDDAHLVRVVGCYLDAGLRNGQPVVVIATPPHRSGFESYLAACGHPLDEARTSGRIVLLDAQQTLAAFMRDGSPQPEAFQAAISGVLERCAETAPGRTVCAYGEMVDVLWGEGNPEGAMELERLWNELARVHAFSLLCGYSMRNVAGSEHAERLRETCRLHHHVTPSERFTALDAGEQQVEVTLLQQRAHALEREVQYREELEGLLRDALAENEALLVREREARAEAERANLSKGRFLAAVSHELRTPLNAIAGYTQLMELGLYAPLDDALRDPLDRIQRNHRQLLRLIDEILSYVQTESGTVSYVLEEVVLGEVLRQEEQRVLPDAQAAMIDLVFPHREGCTRVRADREKLHLVVTNLLSIAVALPRPGGCVRVESEIGEREVTVRVRISGVEAGAELLGEIPEPFAPGEGRLPRPQIGLGLATSRKLVRGMGGELSVSSAPGRGSTLSLILPRATG